MIWHDALFMSHIFRALGLSRLDLMVIHGQLGAPVQDLPPSTPPASHEAPSILTQIYL